MKTDRDQISNLTPEAHGWGLTGFHGGMRIFESIGEAVEALAPEARVHLSLPVHSLILETMKLPSLDPIELAGMAQLQLEKTLSFPVEEVSFGFLEIERAENATTVLCVAVRLPEMETIGKALQIRGAHVEKITPYVARVAAACPPGETVLCVYGELEHVTLAIADHARVAWAHSLRVENVETFLQELPQILLTAEMEGACMDFDRVLLGGNLKSWEEALSGHFSVPVEPLPIHGPLPDVPIDLVPLAWRATTERTHRGNRLRRLLVSAGALYLTGILLAAGYVIWLTAKVKKLDAESAAIRPRMEALQTIQAHWKAVEPAVDPQRATVELLFQLCKNVPKDALHLTEFDETPGQWRVLGEASSAGLAIHYLGKLKEETELSAFRITASPPALLPNEQAQFSIFGKQ